MPSLNKELQRKWANEQIARAHSFTVNMFLGVGNYDQRKASTLEEALAIKQEMIEQYKSDPNHYGQKPMVYAIVGGYNLTIHVE
jgi:hypothetical protein